MNMKRRKHEKGLTLVELVFVVAIILVLAAIFLPIGLSQLEKADNARANADTQAIATALAAFADDLRHFPACDASGDCDKIIDAVNNLQFLAFGDGTGDLSNDYPADSSSLGSVANGKWDLTASDEAIEERNNAYNHLVTNDPNTNGTSNEDPEDYETSGKRSWEGPYIAKLSVDPFGQTYITHVGSMEKDGLPIPGIGNEGEGWILSAGPNLELETGTTSTAIIGDDIGFIFITR
jgi:prepilin-type N-terminal cleavage/methylation domain-containing protein